MLNRDHAYRVNRFVRPGETLPCQQYLEFAGGGGANQSLAFAKAGATVHHAGKIGRVDSIPTRDEVITRQSVLGATHNNFVVLIRGKHDSSLHH